MSRFLALLLFLLTLPLYPILFILIKTTSKGAFIFRQKRIGKNKKTFTIYKFRTMVSDAEKLQEKYKSFNESDGPTFKLRDDPRFTKVGKILSRLAFDELPQLINVIKGEMAFVGPRPLPIKEVEKIPEIYDERFSILPGLTSPWVIKGSHNLPFKTWMELDVAYVKQKNIVNDLKIVSGTIRLLLINLLTSLGSIFKISSSNFFLTLIFAILSYEGLGLSNGHKVAYFAILFLPFLMFLSLKIENRKINIPKNLTITFLIFLLFSFISTLFSSNIQRSFEYLLFLISIFLTFIFVFNKKSEFEKILPSFIFTLSLLFAIFSYSFSIGVLTLDQPFDGFQFVYPKFNSHNHLGDFLVLPIIISLFSIYKRINIVKSLRNIIFFLPFLVFSYSRSAYITLTGTAVVIHLYFAGKNSRTVMWLTRILFVVLILIGFLFVFVTTKEANSLQIYNFLIQNLGLSDQKDFLASRPEYLSQAMESISQNLWFGIGPDNFIFASLKHTTNPLYGVTTSSHNVFADTMVHLGLLGVIVLLHIIYTLIKNSKKSVLFFVFIAMLINFQTDYTFNIYSFFLLFFVIAATFYKEKETIIKTYYFFTFSIFLTIFALLILMNQYFMSQNQWSKALFAYPLNKVVYEKIVKDRIENGEYDVKLLIIYEKLFPNDFSALVFLGNANEKMDKKKTLVFYEKVLDLNLFENPQMIEKVYLLKKEYEGEKKAEVFKKKIIQRVGEVKYDYFISEFFNSEYSRICTKYNWSCENYQ